VTTTDTATEDVSNRTSEALATLFSGEPLDPYPLYDELRETGDGVHFYEPLNGWLAFRHADVQRMGLEWETFTSSFFDVGPMGIHDPSDPEHRRFAGISSRLMAYNDPPRHTQLRSVVRQAFTPRAIAKWESLVTSSVKELLGQFKAGDHVEFMHQLSIDVPIDAICAIVGFPDPDRPRIRAGSIGFQETFEPFIQGAERDHAIRQALTLIDDVDALLRLREEEPADDLISMLLPRIDEENGVSREDLLAQIVFLILAGNETTVNLLGNGINLLLEHADVRRRVQADGDLITPFIEEALRLEPPLHMDPRMTAVPTRLGDTELPARSVVFQVIAAANRDPRAFENPSDFRLDRKRNPHVTFNHGVHNCVGAPLARLEGKVFFEEFLSAFPGFSRDLPACRRTGHLESRGFETIHLVL
jgi:cytochrome P450